MLERRLHYLLELRSDVLDFREQYPFYDDASVAARIEQGIKIYRQEVCPIDVIVTLRCELTGGFKYQGLSVKYDSDLNRPNVWKKLLREREYCERLGWLWSLVTDRTLSNAASEAARKITGYCLRTEATPENVAAAYSIADVIRRRQGEKLDDAVTKSARRLGITRNDGYRLFGVACVLGIIRPDLEKGIGRDIPLCLHGDEE